AKRAAAAPAKLELELAELSAEDRQIFSAELGLQESLRTEILRAIFDAMGQIVFFTIGEDECRAWPLAKGADAVEGAAQIHTDIAKRFVRAEVVSYADFRRVGSMKEAKHQGVYRLEGKTYVVQDGHNLFKAFIHVDVDHGAAGIRFQAIGPKIADHERSGAPSVDVESPAKIEPAFRAKPYAGAVKID